MHVLKVETHSEAQTQTLAASIAPHLVPGDVILLDGSLGAGKTYFVKGLADALGSRDCVTSPTYGLVHTYQTSGPDFIHIDAYRLSGVQEFRDLGLDEFMVTAIVAIEWGSKVKDEFKQYLLISITADSGNAGQRLVGLSYRGSRWQSLFDHLSTQLEGTASASNTHP